MKRIASVIAILSLFFLLGCSQSQPQVGQTVKEDLKGIVTMADYMNEHYGSFYTFAQAMENGDDLVQSLRLYIAHTTDGYVHDPKVMREIWDELCAIRIDLDHPSTRISSADETITFDFDSGREIIPFGFRTTAYTYFTSGGAFPVEDPQAVQAIIDKLSALIEEEEAKLGDEVPYENGAWLWDADGDGMREHVWLDFSDNGDEAPSVYVVRVFGENFDETTYLDGAYSIEGLEAATDDKGPYLVIHYMKGDYYQHDFEATATLRYVDGELQVKEAE